MKSIEWSRKETAEQMCAWLCGDVNNAVNYTAKLMKMIILVDNDKILSTVEWAVSAPDGNIYPMPLFKGFSQRNCKILFEEEILSSDKTIVISQVEMKWVMQQASILPRAELVPLDPHDNNVIMATYVDGHIKVLE